jgi:hypothetical protein
MLGTGVEPSNEPRTISFDDTMRSDTWCDYVLATPLSAQIAEWARNDYYIRFRTLSVGKSVAPSVLSLDSALPTQRPLLTSSFPSSAAAVTALIGLLSATSQ